MEDFGYRLELSKLPRVDAASSAGGRETEERGRVMFLSLEDVREAEREKERKRGTSARETEKRRVESLPEEKEEEEGQSGSGNDRPSALEANIDECPALLALRNQQSEERGIALFPFSPPSLASSPTSSTDPPPPPPPFRFFSTFGFRLSAFGKRRGINGSPISPLSSRIRRRKPRQREETNKGPFFRRDSFLPCIERISLVPRFAFPRDVSPNLVETYGLPRYGAFPRSANRCLAFIRSNVFHERLDAPTFEQFRVSRGSWP